MELPTHAFKDGATDAPKLVALPPDVEASQPEPIALTPERATSPSPATMPPKRTVAAIGVIAVPEHIRLIPDQPRNMESNDVIERKILDLFKDDHSRTIKEISQTLYGDQVDDETSEDVIRAIVKRLCNQKKLTGRPGGGLYQLWSEANAAEFAKLSAQPDYKELRRRMGQVSTIIDGRSKKSDSINGKTARKGARKRR